MYNFCTIITANYFPYALALCDSLLSQEKEVMLFVFVSDKPLEANQLIMAKDKPITIIYSPELNNSSEIGQKLAEKYQHVNQDAYRWCMKPILLTYLLKKGLDRAIYVDCDIYFFSSYAFLFSVLETNNLLLSPHWRSSDPYLDATNFRLNFSDGIFNGGFIGASTGGKEALNFWAMCCLYKCEVDKEKGFFDDQKYLDILHSRFEGVEAIRHKGCNVANWNQVDCKREVNSEGEVLINNEFPIVFIHFTKSFYRGVLYYNDALLQPYLEQFAQKLIEYGLPDQIDVQKKAHQKVLQEEKNKKKSLTLLEVKKTIKRYLMAAKAKIQD